jgi:hypothetical protein
MMQNDIHDVLDSTSIPNNWIVSVELQEKFISHKVYQFLYSGTTFAMRPFFNVQLEKNNEPFIFSK